jgi:hypothetical protein
MDAELVTKFCDIAAQLIVPLSAYAATEVAQRDPADDALVRQLRVAGGAINDALNQVARLTPPAPPPMPPPPTPNAASEPKSGPEHQPEAEPETAVA